VANDWLMMGPRTETMTKEREYKLSTETENTGKKSLILSPIDKWPLVATHWSALIGG